MFNLAPRFNKEYHSTTPANLGPNTYFVCGGKEHLNNWAPFLTSATRKTGTDAAVYTQALYHPEQNLRLRVKGGASINYTAKRLKYSKDDLPGPANYGPKIIEEGCNCSSRQPGKGRLYVCRVPFNRVHSAPSVPTHADENGYDINKFGDISKVPATEYDTTIGPAFYKVPTHELNVTKNLYHEGSRWSKSNTTRFKKILATTPGVGQYDLNTRSCPDQALVDYRELACLFSFLPRFTEAEMLKATREALPAPNCYNVKTSSFEIKESFSVVPRPLVSGAKRFNYLKSDIPGPAEYNINEEFGSKCKQVSFCVKANRWKNTNSDDVPGPNTYTLIGGISENLKNKRNKYSSTDAPFATTGERKMDFIPKNDNPGPLKYKVEDTNVPKLPVNASCFKSRSARFKHLPISEDAGPASYDITEPFKKNTSRKSHNTGKVPFQCIAPRSRTSNLRSPGPADYASQGAIGLKGLSFGYESRFKEKPNESPSPGAYTIHPAVGLSVYKGIATHNIRLKENVMKTKLRLPPGATSSNWHEQLKKKKKLRWFAKPTAEYKHCITLA